MANLQPSVSTEGSIKVVMCTYPSSESALSTANNLVEANYAACVNIIPIATSIYKWEGKIVQDSECYLIVKCLQENLDKVLNSIKSIHPYSTPFIGSFDVTLHNPEYLYWMQSCRN